MREEWKDIKGYEGKYQVSNLGRVYSFYKKNCLKPGKCKDGYLIVRLYKNGKGKPFYIHKLVALHFIPNPNNFPQINHRDENKSNNCVSNLEWCTRKYNMNYGTITQRVSESNKGISRNKGSKHPQARKVLCITTGKRFNCIKEATEYYNMKSNTKSNIAKCCNGKYKYAGKHPDTGEKLKWKYVD